MKIVKMHEGSREAFDDFLEQRLNELEIDNDMADKYFANMHLPVPVIPVQPISFFSKHKNKLWLLVLLFSASIISFLFVNKNINSDNEKSLKGAIIENKASSNNEIVVNNKTIVKQLEIVKEVINTNNLSNAEIVSKKDANTFNYENKNDLEQKNIKLIDISFKTKKNSLKVKNEMLLDDKNQLDAPLKKDTVDINIRNSFKNTGEKAAGKLKNATTKKDQKVDSKIEIKQPDSLYIIW